MKIIEIELFYTENKVIGNASTEGLNVRATLRRYAKEAANRVYDAIHSAYPDYQIIVAIEEKEHKNIITITEDDSYHLVYNHWTRINQMKADMVDILNEICQCWYDWDIWVTR